MAKLLGYDVPDELAAYLAQRQQQPDMAGFDAALAADRKTRERGALAQNLFNAGAIFQGQPARAPEAAVPSAMQEFMARRQMAQQQGPDPLAALKTVSEIDKARRPNPDEELLPLRKQKLEMDIAEPEKSREFRRGEGETERGFRAGESAKDRASRERAAAIAAGRQERVEEKKVKREGVKDTMDLRKEFQADPIVKGTKEMAQAISKIRNVPATGAGDLSLIYSYVKILDPGSVVREGEIKLSREPTPLLTALMQRYSKAARGELLHPDLRRSYKEAAEQLFKAQLQTYQPVADEYGRLATQLGLDPSSVTLDLGFSQGAPPPRAKPAQGPAGPAVEVPPVPGAVKSKSGKWIKQNADGQWEYL